MVVRRNSFKHINKYIKGMNKDLSLNNYTAVNYLHAENLRLRSREGEATTSLSNHIKGNKYKINIDTNFQLVGTIDITSTETVLFMAEQSGNSSIYLFTHDGTDGVQTKGTLLYSDSAVSDKLNFSSSYPIKGISRIETENIRKIYWIDGLGSLRYMNIETPSEYVDASDFEQIPDFDTSEISFNGYTGGTMYSGKYSYVYQLFKTNGAETVFTSTGEIISVANNIGVGESLKNIRGTSKDTITNKGVKLNISGLDSSFSKIRVLAIQYEDLYISPIVRIITEQEYSTSSVDIIDYGQSFGSYDLDEIQFIYPDLIAQTIETKNNILFLGNIEESTIDIQTGIDVWDATAKSYNDDPTPVTYLEDVNEDFDEYAFQNDGATYGATGNNVDWSFTTENKQIGKYDAASYDSLRQFSFNTSNTDDAAFGIKTTWQRGEVYRFGIQFFDEKGRKAFTKWSCDLRIPRAEDGYNIANISGSIINASYIYPIADVKNIPSVGGVPMKWKIVYVERSVENKSILASGVFDFPNEEGSVKDYQHVIPTVNDYKVNYKGGAGTDNYWIQFPTFVSPEINFGSEEYKLAESIQYTSSMRWQANARKDFGSTGVTSAVYGPVDAASFALRIQPYTNSNYIICPAVSIIDKVKTSPDKIDNSIYNLDGIAITHYVINHGGTHDNRGMKGTSLLIKVSAPTITAHGGTDTTAILYGHLIRDLSGAQYGGNSDEARAANTYISCSDLTDSTGNITCHYGDTFITMYDYLNAQKDEDGQPDLTNVIFFPVETQINLALRDDDCYHRITNYDDDTVIRNMTEDGFVDLDQGVTLSKLYTYNNSYSRLNDLYSYIPKPFDYQSSEIFNTRTRRSDIKINGEYSDSWLKFRSSNYIDIDSRYGDIKRLKVFKNRLTFWQEGAFGIFPVGEKELVASGGNEALNVGSTGILDRFDYVSEHNGISTHDALTTSQEAMYFYDDRYKVINKYVGKTIPISIMKGMDSWLNENTDDLMDIQGVYDQDNNEILYIIRNGLLSYVLVLDINMDCYSNFFTMTDIFKIYEMQNTLFSRNDSPTKLYQHNTDSLCTYFGIAHPSKITLLINPNPQENIISVFDVLEILTNVTSSVGVDLTETFNTIRIYNEYQDSGTITLTPGVNIIRRFRTWRMNTLRANTLNRPKFVNSWIKVDLSFTNTSNKELILYNLITNYKPSKMMR